MLKLYFWVLMDIRCKTEDDLHEVAQRALDFLPESTRIVLLSGDLGAGKTALVKEFVSILESDDMVSSPTFSIINEYEGASRIVHIDLYRLETLEEALDIGIEDYIESGDWVFIEWPGLIMPLIHSGYASIDIRVEPDSSRNFRILIDSTLP